MSTTRCRRATTATALALFALALFCPSSAIAVSYDLDPTEAVSVTDESPDIAGNGFGGTVGGVTGPLDIGDSSTVGFYESRVWLKFLLPNPSTGSTSIDTAMLSLGPFSNGAVVPGLVAYPVIDSTWNSGTITNNWAGIVEDAGIPVEFVALNGTGYDQVIDMDVSHWFDPIDGIGIGLGDQLSVVLRQVGEPFNTSDPVGMLTFSNGYTTQLSIETVPEPATAGLLLFAAATVAIVRRRFRKVRC